jgi:hypothetical protein
MISTDISVQIKLIIMYAIGFLALIILLLGLYHKHYSFKNKNIVIIGIVTVIMATMLINVITI